MDDEKQQHKLASDCGPQTTATEVLARVDLNGCVAIATHGNSGLGIYADVLVPHKTCPVKSARRRCWSSGNGNPFPRKTCRDSYPRVHWLGMRRILRAAARGSPAFRQPVGMVAGIPIRLKGAISGVLSIEEIEDSIPDSY